MTINYNYRCGEIFFSDTKNCFILICKFCDQHFNKFESFSYHKSQCFPSQEITYFVDIIKCTTQNGNLNKSYPHNEKNISLMNKPITIANEPIMESTKTDNNLHNFEEINIDINNVKQDSYAENPNYSDNYFNCDLSCDPPELLNQEQIKKQLKLKRHIMCDFCFQPFQTNEELILHKSNAHSNGMEDSSKVKLFTCRICSKKFSRYGRFRIHVNQIHKGSSLEQYDVFDEKPYKCTVCPAEFRRMNTLRIHIRRHTGDKPYKCEKCSKRFATRDALNTHSRTHTHEKFYCCDLCPKTYLQASGLWKHKKKHPAIAEDASDDDNHIF